MVKLIKDLLSDSGVWAGENNKFNKLNYLIYESSDFCERGLTIIIKIIIK
jgi:hypothetical protein